MKNLRKYLRFLYSPFMLGLVVTFSIAYVAFQYYSHYQDSIYKGESAFFDLLRDAHQKSIDYRLLMRGEVKGHPDVAILAIDEASLDQEGRWPWPREKIGRVVEKTIGYGAKVIAFDIIFAEPDSNSAKPTLARVKNTLESKNISNRQIDELLNNELKNADSDKIFSETIRKYSDHLVMGSYVEQFDVKELEAISPHVDSCIDVLHERSAEAKYWTHDLRRPAVVDPNATKRALPTSFKENLDQYFSILEAHEISKWLDENPVLAKELQISIVKVGLPSDLPPAMLIYDFLENNTARASEGLTAFLQQPFPEDRVQKLFVSFTFVLNQKQKAIIQAKLRETTKEYCFRFMLTAGTNEAKKDELLSADIFKDRYSGNEIASLADSIIWETVWNDNVAKEKPTAPKFADYLSDLNTLVTRHQVTPISRWWLNIPLLTEPTKYTSFFNAHLDTDGTLRRNMFLTRRGNNFFTSLALGSYLLRHDLKVSAAIASIENSMYKGVPAKIDGDTLRQQFADFTDSRDPASPSEQAGFQILDKIGKHVMSIPVDSAARMLINYSGSKHSFPHISAADILSDRDDAQIAVNPALYGSKTILVKKKDFLKDKVLFFGATATGIFDLRVTPFEENFPGVETHANMVANLLVEHARATGKADSVKGMPGFLKAYPEREAKFMLPAMLIAGILFSALFAWVGSIAGLGITAAAIGSVYGLDKFVLFDSGIVITVFFPMALIMSLFITLTFYKYFTEERKKRQLKGTFAKYVSPAIVDEILADPENIELGGKRMELTVMFSDVRGFTTISEKLDPGALSDLLNSYLTPMTNLVFENKGTLDKYMGDAIMAFWGAPVHFKDHAKHACRCALQMLVKLKELQDQYKAQGLPSIDIGIGLNTGDMNVGNMGSDTVRSYTVMGDAVNLGSRLEGINKQYGTRIIISEFTHKEVSDAFVCREIDWVKVKGKLQPVRIFELIGDNSVDDGKKALVAKFQEGFKAYHDRDWDKGIAVFTECLHMKPEDEPSQLYLERCQEYKKHPPTADWDGVFTMETK